MSNPTSKQSLPSICGVHFNNLPGGIDAHFKSVSIPPGKFQPTGFADDYFDYFADDYFKSLILLINSLILWEFGKLSMFVLDTAKSPRKTTLGSVFREKLVFEVF